MTRRAQLLAEYADARTALAVLMGAALVEAATDAVGDSVTAGQLYDRFLGWVRWDDPPRETGPPLPP